GNLMSENLSPDAVAYKEYVDAVRPPNPPRAELRDFQLVASTVRLWWLRTRHPLAVVLQDGFLDSVTDLRLRKEDRVEVVANSGGDGPAEHATLVVTEADKHGKAKVSLLHLYKRGGYP